jgi:hypothetical protein
MLLIVLTSISVVVAARWQRELKIYTDCELSGKLKDRGFQPKEN